IIIDAEFATERRHGFRPYRIAQSPSRDSGFVHTLIPDITVAGVPEPVPIIRETLFVVRTHRCGAEEQIPIQSGWCRTIRCVADRGTELVAQRLAHVELANQTLLERRDRLDLERPAPMLRSYLHDALGLALHLDHPHAFVDVVSGGLFPVNVFTRLHRPD